MAFKTFKEIAELLGSTPECGAGIDPSTLSINDFAIDSRSVIPSSSTLFIAIKTDGNDGHRYLNDAYGKGVRCFIINRDSAVTLPDDASIIKVDDTMKALRQLAAASRATNLDKTTVIGITGSRGKTIVKEMLYVALSGLTDAQRSPRSFNSQTGVPLSLLEINRKENPPKVAIFEAGISKAGEMENLSSIIKPDIGIITCVTDEHSQGFESHSQQIDEKLRLFDSAKTIIFNDDDHALARRVNALFGNDNERRLIAVKAGYPKMRLERFVDETVKALGLPQPETYQTAVDTRLDITEGVNNCKLIIDEFTPDTVSLRGALDFMLHRNEEGLSKTLIIPIDEMIGDQSDFEPIIEHYGIDRLIAISRKGTNIAFSGQKQVYSSMSELMSSLSSTDFSNEIILIKDTPETSLKDIYAMLEAKQHETVLDVNLDAVVHNFNFFKSHLKRSTGLICMLKAAGYGAGSLELARTLQSHGAAYIAVAVVDEGVELRNAGITMPIMVLNPRAQNMKIMFDYRLEPEVYSFELLDNIIRAAERYGVTRFPIHLKIETGMSRLGFLPEEMDELGKRLKETDRVKAETMFSHLSCADDPKDDEYTIRQFKTFEETYATISSILPAPPKRHILNSTGIVRFPQYQYDFARLGIGLYGVPTLSDGSMDSLENVSTLTSVIISLKHWEAGRSIGYNRRTRLERDSIIATIPVGYADGMDRRLGNRNGEVWIHGQRAQIVGNVCMDLFMADVTDIVNSGKEVKVGDRVEIFGSHITPTEIASQLGTIPYEILTSVSPRVKRVYYRE